MASPVDTSVKFYREDFPGAPTLNGVAGSLIGLLDACLCTGFGLRSATSLVVAGGVATLTLASDAKNGNLLHSVILVDGSSITALNGEQRVTWASSTELKFATAAADGTATGSITVKTAPAGWLKPHSGANLAAFKSALPESTGCLLRVDDTDTTSARVVGYESMADIDAGTGPFPTPTQVSGGMHLPKSMSANTTAIPWEFVADARGFHYIPASAYASSTIFGGRSGWWFGDITPRKSGDAFCCALLAGGSSSDSYGANYRSMNNAARSVYLARSYTGLGASVRAGRFSPVLAPGGAYNIDDEFSGLAAHCGTYPNAADNALVTAPLFVLEGSIGTTAVWRGTVPGVYHSPQRILANTFAPRAIIEATEGLPGRLLLAAPASAGAVNLAFTDGCTFYDITGPWR